MGKLTPKLVWESVTNLTVSTKSNFGSRAIRGQQVEVTYAVNGKGEIFNVDSKWFDVVNAALADLKGPKVDHSDADTAVALAFAIAKVGRHDSLQACAVAADILQDQMFAQEPGAREVEEVQHPFDESLVKESKDTLAMTIGLLKSELSKAELEARNTKQLLAESKRHVDYLQSVLARVPDTIRRDAIDRAKAGERVHG